MDKIESALRVIVNDRKIRAYLAENDPQALKQAEEALALEITTNSETASTLDDLHEDWTIQVVKRGEVQINSADVNEQDYAFQSTANGLLVLLRVDDNNDTYGEDVVIDLDEVRLIHIY